MGICKDLCIGLVWEILMSLMTGIDDESGGVHVGIEDEYTGERTYHIWSPK